MRFITDFEHTHEAYEYSKINEVIASYKGRGQMDLGYQIGDSFGWTEKQDPFKIKNTLEIEAFLMDKWVEFKQKLSTAIRYGHGASSVESLLKELESFGKPAGAAKQQDNG